LEVVVNASPTLFSRHAPRRSPLLLELASLEEVLVNGSPSLFVCAEPSAVRGAHSTLLLELASTPAKLVRGKQKTLTGLRSGQQKTPLGLPGGLKGQGQMLK
jgi:hypothetical protein